MLEKMISRGGDSRPPQNHFKNDFKGGEFNTQRIGVILYVHSRIERRRVLLQNARLFEV